MQARVETVAPRVALHARPGEDIEPRARGRVARGRLERGEAGWEHRGIRAGRGVVGGEDAGRRGGGPNERHRARGVARRGPQGKRRAPSPRRRRRRRRLVVVAQDGARVEEYRAERERREREGRGPASSRHGASARVTTPASRVRRDRQRKLRSHDDRSDLTSALGSVQEKRKAGREARNRRDQPRGESTHSHCQRIFYQKLRTQDKVVWSFRGGARPPIPAGT